MADIPGLIPMMGVALILVVVILPVLCWLLLYLLKAAWDWWSYWGDQIRNL